MKRREFIQYGGAGILTAAGIAASAHGQTAQAQTANALSIQWLGHTCFLFSGQGRRILVNPFRPLGCAAGYRAPNVSVDLVLISSRLFDEGSTDSLPDNIRVLLESGVYDFRGLQIQGIRMDHDRLGGRRFGTNTAWRWTQAGLSILHLGGGAAVPITVEQQILMGRPDVLIIPVGGGTKAYTPEEAKQALQVLNPKIIIPTYYRTAAADSATCDILPLDNFLTLMEGTPVQRNGDTVSLRPSDLPATGSKIEVFSYH